MKQKNFIHVQIYSYTDVLNVEKLNLNTESNLDIIINDNDNISQETFECFTEAIEENPKIDIIKYINQEIGEIGDIQHRIILRYDNEFIPVVKNIIADFNLTNNIKS